MDDRFSEERGIQAHANPSREGLSIDTENADRESVLSAFETVRDQLVFTNKRIIAASVTGFAGRNVDHTSIPYSKIQTFSVETVGLLGTDCELEIYSSSIGKICFENWGGFDIVLFNKVISTYVLN